MSNKPIVIIPFTLPWNHSADYQKQTALELERRGHQVIAYLAEEAKFFLKTNAKVNEKKSTISFYRPKFWLPFRRLEIINRLNFILDQWLLNLRLGIFTKKIIWVFDPQFNNFADHFSSKISLYDCVDCHSSLNKKVDCLLHHQEKILIKKVDYFFVNSHSLKLLHQKIRKPILLPQGVKTNLNKEFLAQKASPHKNPVIGYIGGINYRLDFSLLGHLIVLHPDWHFEFWGQIQTDEQDKKLKTKLKLKLLQRLPNTIWKKANNLTELASAIQGFDLAIIPYDCKQPSNYYSFPMKTFEYFLFGKPVISTKILELTRPPYNQIVTTHHEWMEFNQALEKRLNQPWSRKKQLLQFKLAQKHSWSAKIDLILNTINS